MIVARSRGVAFHFLEERSSDEPSGFYPLDERHNKDRAYEALDALIARTGGGGFYRYVGRLVNERRALLERLLASPASPERSAAE